MRLPDFYLIGAMKSATTTLAWQLGAQDGIHMSPVKEPNFFSDDRNYRRGVESYARLFRDALPEQLTGEASTHYTKWPDHPQTVERLKAATPDAKFIYMIRHPVDRARSHAIHEIRKGRGLEVNEIAAATPALWQYGCYATQLERWLEHFPPERFLIVATERLSAEPITEFLRALDFLGTEGHWRPELSELHASAEGYRALPFERVLLDWAPLRTLRRHLIPKSWRNAVRKSRALETDTSFTDDTVAMIAEKTAPDLERLGEMCGIDLSIERYLDVALGEHFSLNDDETSDRQAGGLRG